MKYAIMIYDYSNEEQIFLGIKEMVEVRSTIEKGIEEYAEENSDLADFLDDVNVYVIAEDFKGNIKRIVNKVITLNSFFHSNAQACYFSLDEICSFSKVKVNL